jgi:ERO1-like protein alpha
VSAAAAGVATALKILFSAKDCIGVAPADTELPFGDELELERNEVIALINLLGRFSHSLETYHKLTQELQREQGIAPSLEQETGII